MTQRWTLPGSLPRTPLDLKALRSRLDLFQRQLLAALKRGVPTPHLLQARALLLDHLLLTLWERAAPGKAALIATGGYGAGELFPHSDIDLLILTGSPLEGEKVSAFLQQLWDLGLKVGHSVRTLSECLEWARRDQTVMTTLLTRRLLAGETALFEALSEGLSRLWSYESFYRAKLEERTERHRRQRHLAFTVEPHLKEGLGGLRDLQLLRWLLLFRFGRGSFELLLQEGVLPKEQLERLERAEAFLKRLRFALHLAAGRDEEVLRFEYQKTVAEWLGFHGSGNAPIEAMMEACFRAMRKVVGLSELVLGWLDPKAGSGLRQSLDLDFEVQGRCLALKEPERLFERPALALELFRKGQQFPGLAIAPATLKALLEALELPEWGVRLRRDREAASAFLQLLEAREGVARQLFAMHRCGLLPVFIPELGFVTGKTQFDLFHRYPVDEHLLRTVLELRRIAQARYREELPLAHDLFSELHRPELLLLAALFHDMGKGYGQDHSLVGERLWRSLSRRFGLDLEASEEVGWLIRHHLLLSTTAQKKDITDPEVQAGFARLVGTEERLRNLYLLTVADVRATNPSLWTPWREALFRELFLSARELFRRKRAITVDRQAVIEERRQRARRMLSALGGSEEAVAALWRTLPRDYFLGVTVEELVWQTLEMLSARRLPHISYWAESPRGHDEIFIYAQDRPFLFAQITAVLARLSLNVIRADLHTSRLGLAVDRFQVVALHGGSVREWSRQQRICHRLRECLEHPREECFELRRPGPRIDRTLFPPRLSFREEGGWTRLEVVAADRPGLLSEIGRVFARLGLNLHRAQVVTLGMRAEDLFDLQGPTGKPLTQEEQERLREELLAIL